MKTSLIIAILAVSFLSPNCFGADDVQFEGKSMDTWLNNLIGIPDNGRDPVPPNEKEETQRQAVAAFQRMSSREYDYLVKKLPSTTENKFANGEITVAFKIAGTNASPAIPKLIALLSRGDEPTAWSVARCLVGIGTNSIAPLIDALSDKNANVRAGAAYALGQIGPPAKPAVPSMLEKLKTDELKVRLAIIGSLGFIRQYPDQVIPVLTENLKCENPDVRGNAAMAISCFGNDVGNAAPILFKLLNDNNDRVRNNAAGAVLHANLGKEQIPLLISNADNPDARVRSLIAQALGKQAVYTNEVYPALLKLSKDPDRYVRESAGVTWNQIGYKPPMDVVHLRGLYQ
jgi:HEAT repeat protein